MGIKLSKRKHKPRITKAQIPWLLRGAIRSNNVETMQYLLTYPHHVNPSMVIDGVCPINLAIELDRPQMVKMLIKAGADVQVADAPRYPLHQAAIFGRPDITEQLIKSGASVKALTGTRQSCLHLLAGQSGKRFLETAKVLLRYGADPNCLDDKGLAPMHSASVEMIETLVAHELTNLNIVSKDGDTPLLTATKDRKDQVVLALIKIANGIALAESHRKMPRLGSINRQHSAENGRVVPGELSDAEANGEEAGCEFPSPVLPTSPLLTGPGVSAGAKRSGSGRGPRLANVFFPSSHHRTSSSKSSTSSRMTLLSMANSAYRGFVGRANSAASVNVNAIYPMQHNRINVSHDGHGGKNGASAFRMLGGLRKSRSLLKNHQVVNHMGSQDWHASSNQRLHNIFNLNANGVNLKGLRSTSTTLSANKLFHVTRDNGASNNCSSAVPMRKNSTAPSQRANVDLDKPDKIGMTALMIAAEAGEGGFAMFRVLLNAGADISMIDKMGMTALHYACYVGAISIVRFALEHPKFGGACASGPSKANSIVTLTTDALHASCSASSPTQANMSSASSSIFNTSTLRHSQHSDVFAETGRTVYDLINNQDKYGRTPIYLATGRGHTEVVNYLLSIGAEIHIPNKESKSPLYISAYFGHLEIVNALLRAGAKVDQSDSHRKTPLYVATYHGRFDIVELLLSAGASVNSADKNGKTPLYIAVLHGHLALASKLLAAGASVNCPDHEGLGPLHMAVKFPKLDIPMIKLLLNHGCDPVNLAAFTRWLLAHGIIPDECIQGDSELSTWLRHEESSVKSLKRLCRAEIQRALGNSDSMRFKIAKLPLPEHLLSYVSMKAL